MSAILPIPRGIKVDRLRLVDYGGRLVPPLGGAVQTLQRLGTRWALDFTVPIQRTEPDGRLWGSALAKAQLDGVLVLLRQDNLAIGFPAATGLYPLVDGAAQSGSTLNLKNFAVGYTVREGQVFTVITGGRRYLHMAQVDTVANGAGKMALTILPMLRVGPTDGALCEFSAPFLQGSITAGDIGGQRLPGGWTDFGNFTVQEDE